MRRLVWGLLAVGVAVAIVPSYVRVHRVAGSSDAPSFLLGDRIVVFKAAYDLRIPYTDRVVVSFAGPMVGDVVTFRSSRERYVVFKRVVGMPGDTISMTNNRLVRNGERAVYETLQASDFRDVPEAIDPGDVIERETIEGRSHLIAWSSSGSSVGSFGPVVVPKDHYFLVGDNRDNSEDSRMYGAVPRTAIVGRVVSPGRTGP